MKKEHEFVDAEGNHWKALPGDILFRTHPPGAAEPMLESRAAAAEILRLAEENERLRSAINFGLPLLRAEAFALSDCRLGVELGAWLLRLETALRHSNAPLDRICPEE